MTVRDIRAKYNPLVLRYFLLSAHYRSPINFSKEGLEQAQSALERLGNCNSDMNFAIENREAGAKDEALAEALKNSWNGMKEAMDDDFNTAGAIGCIFDAVRAINVHLTEHKDADKETLAEAQKYFSVINDIFGFFPKAESAENENAEIDQLIAERNEARKAKNFKRSDEIRDLLASKGITIEDTPQGTRWKKQL